MADALVDNAKLASNVVSPITSLTVDGSLYLDSDWKVSSRQGTREFARE